MSEIRRYVVTGMSCAHCENAVRQEVGELPGVEDLRVSAAEGALVLSVDEARAPGDAEVLAAVDEAGYQAVRAS